MVLTITDLYAWKYVAQIVREHYTRAVFGKVEQRRKKEPLHPLFNKVFAISANVDVYKAIRKGDSSINFLRGFPVARRFLSSKLHFQLVYCFHGSLVLFVCRL